MTITALYASLLGLLLVVLSYRVAQRRMRFQVGVGTGANPELERAIRVHGNFIEYVPFALILLGLFEANGGPPVSVHAAGATLLVLRIAHAIGLTGSSGRSPGRFVGALGTWLLIIALSIGNLWHVLG
jgi:hypothetical protein